MGHTSTTINSDGGICPIRDVCSVLGIAANGDWGYLCSNEHGQTKKWALQKPERINKIGDITEAERTANNRGLVPLSFNTVYAAAKAVAEGGEGGIDWVYLAPRPGTDWQRITDWDGYYHAQLPWVQIAEEADDITAIRFSGLENIANLPTWMAAFSFMKSSPAGCYSAIILYRTNTDGSLRTARVYLIAAVIDVDDWDKQSNILHKVAREGYDSGDFKAVPALVIPTAAPHSLPMIMDGEWQTACGTIYPLPSKPLAVHIKTAAESVDTRYFEGFTLALDSSSGTRTDSSWTFTFTARAARSASAPVSGNLYVEVDFSVQSWVSNDMEYKSLGYLKATLAPGQSAAKQISGSAMYIAEAPNHCNIKCDVRISSNSSMLNSQSSTYWLQIEE